MATSHAAPSITAEKIGFSWRKEGQILKFQNHVIDQSGISQRTSRQMKYQRLSY